MWKQFNEKYEISSLGEVRNYKTNIILKPSINSKGYKRISLHGKKYFIHRLVATLFISNNDNLLQVNHIDGNKLNNNYKNLEWCTNQYNNIHSFTKGRISGKTKLSKEAVLNILSNKTLSAKDLSILYNVNVQTIYAVRKNRNIKRLLYI